MLVNRNKLQLSIATNATKEVLVHEVVKVYEAGHQKTDIPCLKREYVIRGDISPDRYSPKQYSCAPSVKYFFIILELNGSATTISIILKGEIELGPCDDDI